MDERSVISDASPDALSDIAQDIEACAQRVMDFTKRAVDDGTIAPLYVPEALLLAAVELAVEYEGSSAFVADWLERVAGRLREHIEPVAGSVQ